MDELNAALGLARALGLSPRGESLVDAVQERLVGLMGELATLPQDAAAYCARYPHTTQADVEWLEAESLALESGGIRFDGWVRPGVKATPGAAQLDVARTVCRRAERWVQALREAGEAASAVSALFLNRLSDFLWLLARFESHEQDK